MALTQQQLTVVIEELADAAAISGLEDQLASVEKTQGIITASQYTQQVAENTSYLTAYDDALLAQINGGTPFVVIPYGSPLCYVRGAKILTVTGEVAVEDLKIGDMVVTSSGDRQPVRWIGYRHFDFARHPAPDQVRPIRIAAGAFADNVPHRDLCVSPDHAIFVDGKLICARQLVNDMTIRVEKGLPAVEYFHVELEAHSIILAEGLATESYLDTGNRGFFANSTVPLVLHPDMSGTVGHPTRELGSCAPFVWQEEAVRPIWERLASRATSLGHQAPPLVTGSDPDLVVVAQGQTLSAVNSGNGLYQFILPPGTQKVRVVSRAAAPSDIRPWMEDRRRLGVYVERIVLHGAQEVRDLPIDHPTLSHGWWAVERDGTELRRWTDGDAVLPLPVMDGSVLLEIRATNSGMTYKIAA